MKLTDLFPASSVVRAPRDDRTSNRRTSSRGERHVGAQTNPVRAADRLGVFFPPDLFDRWQPELTHYHE